MAQNQVIIIGAGLAGLCCALSLEQQGLDYLLVDASDAPGGRIRTDNLDGFLLDRGFQVLLTAYPEARRILDLGALDLRAFYPGARVWHSGRFHKMADPFRHPLAGLGSLFTDVGSTSDKLKVAELRADLRRQSMDQIWDKDEQSTLDALRERGFSEEMIQRFFRPFLGGVLLERELNSSSRMFEFVFKMFAEGDTAVPARGMEAIPAWLAAQLPAERLLLQCRVTELEGMSITLADGSVRTADAIVIAADNHDAHALEPEIAAAEFNATACLYYAANTAPESEPILMLNGEEQGLVNNIAVMSRVAETYAPAGQELIAVSCIGLPDERELEGLVRSELKNLFGSQVTDWRHLRSYRIPRALPSFPPAGLKKFTSLKSRRVFACGDYQMNPSINGAMLSGRRTAEAVIAALS